MSKPARFQLVGASAVIAVIAALLFASHSAHASGAILPSAGSTDPPTVDVEIAVAVTPFGATRWSRLTTSGASTVMWLVPARPGAALDWASDAWLGALHDASTPRVAPPTATPPCGMSGAPQRTASWGSTAAKKFPRAVTIHPSESEVRAHVASRGFEVSTTSAARIIEAYAKGYALVSLELDTGGAIVSTPTLRVSDDGAGIIPLALTGNRQTNARVTAMVIGEGGALLPGARDLDADGLIWGKAGSDFSTARATTLVDGGGLTWLRESSSHDVVFDGVAVPRSEPIQPLVTGYFREANGQLRVTCNAAARAAGSSTGLVGRACAAGALGRVPGGAACVPSAGDIDPAAFVCGSGVDDLAIALSGTAPTKASVSRLTGLVARGTFGLDLPISPLGAPLSPVVFAGAYDACPVPAPPPGGGVTGPGVTDPAPGPDERPYHYDRTSGGCSGSSTTVIYEDTGEAEVVADEGCGASSTGTDSSTTNDDQSCGGDSTSTSESSSSSSGSSDDDDDDDDDSSSSWDDSDDDDDDDSSDSCDSTSSSSTSSSSGSTDDEAAASPKSIRVAPAEVGPQAKHGKKHGKAKHKPKTSGTKKRRGSSPVSRYALLFVALILPLRRSLRIKKL